MVRDDREEVEDEAKAEEGVQEESWDMLEEAPVDVDAEDLDLLAFRGVMEKWLWRTQMEKSSKCRVEYHRPKHQGSAIAP